MEEKPGQIPKNDAAIESPQERIVCPVVRTNDGVEHAGYCRHELIITEIILGPTNKDKKYRWGQWERGFRTSTGRFVGRIEAARIATEAGQIQMSPGAELHSEDLW